MLKGGNSTIRFLLYCSFAIMMIGAWFKIQHYPYPTEEIIVLGAIGFFILYPIRFIQKESKNWLDYVILLFIELQVGSGIFFMVKQMVK